jgi:putative NADH-flavin reductase
MALRSPYRQEQIMKLTIVAATGGIGRQILTQAVAAGHDVTAVVRDPSSLPPDVRAVTVDLANVTVDPLVDAVTGADAVLSALGPRSAADAGIVSRGTGAVVDAMRAAGTRRLLAVSAAPIGTIPSPQRPNPPKHDPGDGFVMRHVMSPMIKTILRRPYADLAIMEDRVSELDWTLARPPRLTDRPLTGTYRLAYGQNLRRGLAISRADVAHAMLALIDDPQAVRRTVGIAY